MLVPGSAWYQDIMNVILSIRDCVSVMNDDDEMMNGHAIGVEGTV